MYNNIEVMGISMVKEGTYDKISIMGKATANGAIVAEKIEVAGTMRCNEPVEARHVHCAGSLTLAKSMKAQSFIVNGKVYAMPQATVKAQELEINGSGIIEGDAHVGCAILRGYARIGNLYAEQVFLNQNKKWFNFTKKSKLGTIEAKQVYAAECIVDKITGTHIEIGRNASIGYIECNGTLKIHPSASVGRVVGEYIIVS